MTKVNKAPSRSCRMDLQHMTSDIIKYICDIFGKARIRKKQTSPNRETWPVLFTHIKLVKDKKRWRNCLNTVFHPRLKTKLEWEKL